MRGNSSAFLCVWFKFSEIQPLHAYYNIRDCGIAIHLRSAEAPSIYLPIPRTELLKKSVYYYCANLWNELPVPIRLLNDMDSFKLEINKIIV